MTVKGIKYLGYSPWIAETPTGQRLIQIFVSEETGEIIAVHAAFRRTKWDTWGVPVIFEKAD